MRKPVAVVGIIMTLLLLLTLARRLAQPAIGEDPAISQEHPAIAVDTPEPSSQPASSLPPPPSRPVLAVTTPAVSADVKREVAAQKSTVRTRSSRKSSAVKTRADAQQQLNASEPVDHATTSASPFRALLGQPSSRVRRVVDHGVHGIGTPQWIEPLSGPKTRVPVRDFAAEKSLKPASPIAPIAVPVNSAPRSEANSAH
jgi:hypothetical protein